MFSSDDELLQVAQTWGFQCELNEQGLWCIHPSDLEQRWLLQQRSDRWLLVVDGVAQISFYGEDALRFLERRRS